MLYLCLFVQNKRKKQAVGVILEFSYKPGSITSCFLRKSFQKKNELQDKFEIFLQLHVFVTEAGTWTFA